MDPESTVPQNDHSDVLRGILTRLAQVEQDLTAFAEQRGEEIRRDLDRRLDKLVDELGHVRQRLDAAGIHADARLKQSWEKIAAGHDELKRRLEAARTKPAADVHDEARDAIGTVSRAVRDALLHLGGPIDPPSYP